MEWWIMILQPIQMQGIGMSEQKKYIIELITQLLQNCRCALLENTKMPVFTNFSQVFDRDQAKYLLTPQKLTNLQLTTHTLPQLARLLQIANFSLNNISTGTYLTKRSLFYHLRHYYSRYSTIDADISLLCCNLTLLARRPITRSMINIVASGRALIYGRISLWVDGKQVSSVGSGNLIMVPACYHVQVKEIPTKTRVLIVEKESIFYEVMSRLKEVADLPHYLLITAKGYPDVITRQFLHSLGEYCERHSQDLTFYYCGDYDVFGFDIFLFYAFGDWVCKGIMPRIHWMDCACANNIFDQRRAVKEKFDDKDAKKMDEILKKDIFRFTKQEKKEDNTFEQKCRRIYERLARFREKKEKCEMQVFMEAAHSPLWFAQLIEYIEQCENIR